MPPRPRRARPACCWGSGDEVLPPNVYAPIKERALQSVRGTVQADILKEDQAQNTCIFSTSSP
jgi:methylmalonyl-CoA mutase